MKTHWAILLFLAIVYTPTPLQSQARLIINNNAYIRMNGGTAATPIYIVVANSNANAVSTTGTGGNLVSEGEFNKLRWNIGIATGTYTLPYTSNPATTNTKFPFSLQITASGIGAAGLIDFSTYETTTDMNIPWASMVTHMTDADNVPADNSLKVVDRYWIHYSSGYATKPDVNMTFGYVDNATELYGTNTIVESNLVAQRWNDGINEWEGDFSNSFISYGIANVATNQVTGVDITPAEFHEAWVLVDNSSLLPVELISFSANCIHNNAELTWVTASETNSDRYEIEKSFDGTNYFQIGIVDAVENSSVTTDYSFTDNSTFTGTVFYRLKQFDQNGVFTYFAPTSLSACTNESGVSAYTAANNTIHIVMDAENENEIMAGLYSVDGKLVDQRPLKVEEGFNHFSYTVNPASGIYFLHLNNNEAITTFKLYIR